MSFYEVIEKYPYDRVKNMIYNASENQVLNALSKDKLDETDLATLLSPVAEKHLEVMAEKSHSITLERFGKTIKIYSPIYLSNFCVNSCVYCGFNHKNKIPRLLLTSEEIENEAKIVSSYGIQNVILVTGDNMKKFSFDMLAEAVLICSKYFSFIAMEVPSLTLEQYKILHNAGADGLTMFQETYIKHLYNDFHPHGPKSDYLTRLNTPEEAASAGVREIGLGVLLGLTDYRIDTFYMCLHSKYLSKKFWKSHISASFPRIRQATGDYIPKHIVSDKSVLQLIFTYRLFSHNAGINISTRESKDFRDKLMYLGATIMSAGSRTEPGGYSKAKEEAGQFHIEDNRSVCEFCEAVKKQGYDPIFKDWDTGMQKLV